KITDSIPTLAHIPARALPAFPDEAVGITRAPASRGLTIASALGRSLNEGVGVRPSSLIYNFFTPKSLASPGPSLNGFQHTGRGGANDGSSIGSSARYRQMVKLRSVVSVALLNSLPIRS